MNPLNDEECKIFFSYISFKFPLVLFYLRKTHLNSETCNNGYSQKTNLKSYMNIYTEKNFFLEMCTKCFHKGDFNKHLRIHT